MGYYPIFLDLRDRPCVVIGGGSVAQRKVEGLISAGAQVTVISPRLSAALAHLRDASKIKHMPRNYSNGDLAGFSLAFVATNDLRVNALVAREGHERTVLVNAVDDTENCDFIMPSILRRGDVTIAVSTGGASPALARKIREELEEHFSADYVQLLELVAEVRQALRSQGKPVDPEVWNAALTPALRDLLALGQREAARQKLLAALLSGASGRAPEDEVKV